MLAVGVYQLWHHLYCRSSFLSVSTLVLVKKDTTQNGLSLFFLKFLLKGWRTFKEKNITDHFGNKVKISIFNKVDILNSKNLVKTRCAEQKHTKAQLDFCCQLTMRHHTVYKRCTISWNQSVAFAAVLTSLMAGTSSRVGSDGKYKWAIRATDLR